MNFRFFGDSWFWTWYQPKVDGDKTSNFCRSKAMGTIDKYENGLSLIRMLFQEMGHAVNNYARPGAGFRSTRLAYESNGWGTKEIPSINIIFISSNLRKFHHTGLDSPFTQYEVDLSNVENFIKCYDDLMIEDLKNLMHYDNPNDTYLVVSGQENLPMDVFMEAKNKIKETHGWELPNWHLLSESILVDLACTYNGTHDPFESPQAQREWLMSKTPRFGLCRASEIGVHLNADNVQNIGEDLVSMIEEHNKIFMEFWNDGSNYHPTILMTPDPSHLGFTGQIYFVDFVMKFLEENDLVY